MTRGAALGYALSPELLVELNYASGERDQLLATDSAELILLRLRWLFGSLTQLNAGLGQRTLGTRYTVRTTDGGDTRVETTMKVAAAELSFGSRLDLGPLRVTCDWLGVVVPVARLAYKDGFPDDADPAEKEANEDQFGKIENVPTLEFVRLGAGVTF
jgi:hypothetical protein